MVSADSPFHVHSSLLVTSSLQVMIKCHSQKIIEGTGPQPIEFICVVWLAAGSWVRNKNENTRQKPDKNPHVSFLAFDWIPVSIRNFDPECFILVHPATTRTNCSYVSSALGVFRNLRFGGGFGWTDRRSNAFRIVCNDSDAMLVKRLKLVNYGFSREDFMQQMKVMKKSAMKMCVL